MISLLMLIGRGLTLAFRGHHELVLENLALRHQLMTVRRDAKRPRLHASDRFFWIVLAQMWRYWRTALVLVQPDTVVRWHREWLRHRWTRRSRRVGRPPVDPQICTLVKEMATTNPLWGAPRIHGELRMLGIEVSERTVSRLLERYPRPRPQQTWKTFLKNHLASAMSMDFFTVPTLTGRILFVLVILSHHRRRILHVNVTAHPTGTWAAQQLVDACPDDTAPRWLHRDRDRIYSDVFQRRVAGLGITEVVSAPASPWQNPFAERLIGSIRRECLDHVIIVNEAHLRNVLTSYGRYYHRSRTHLGLEKDTPDRRLVSETSTGLIVAIPEVGGLHHRYERRAA